MHYFEKNSSEKPTSHEIVKQKKHGHLGGSAIKASGMTGMGQAIKASYETVSIINPDQASTEEVKVFAAFCPLYAQGSLEASKLMPEPADITESRVGGKWDAIKKVLGAMARYSQTSGQGMHLTAAFANKAVLLGGEPTEADISHLEHHKEAYHQAIDKFCVENDILYTFAGYDDLNVPFPQFVNPKDAIPSNDTSVETQDYQPSVEASIITDLNDLIHKLGVPTTLSQNKSTRQKLKQLVKAFGPETAYWLTAGYLVFDYRIPELVGKDGVYLSAERFAPIHRIAHLTPGLKEMARVEISA